MAAPAEGAPLPHASIRGLSVLHAGLAVIRCTEKHEHCLTQGLLQLRTSAIPNQSPTNSLWPQRKHEASSLLLPQKTWRNALPGGMGQPTVPKDTTKAGSFPATSSKRKGHDPESLRQCRDEKLGGGEISLQMQRIKTVRE